MKSIHVLRKPCSEPTVAANVLRHGTGGLNVDGCRVGTNSDVSAVHATRRSDYPQSYVGNGAGWGRTRGGYAGDEVHWEPNIAGRWPANLIFQHLPTCEQTGTREEPGYTINRFTDGMKPFGEGAGHPYESKPVPPSTAPVWTCAEGCPVAGSFPLEGRSTKPSASGVSTRNKGASLTGMGGTDTNPSYFDAGGASRFFKQVGGMVTLSGGDRGRKG